MYANANNYWQSLKSLNISVIDKIVLKFVAEVELHSGGYNPKQYPTFWTPVRYPERKNLDGSLTEAPCARRAKQLRSPAA